MPDTTISIEDRLRAAHGDELCHICGELKRSKGHPLCSYPHRRLMTERVGGFGVWREPENVA